MFKACLDELEKISVAMPKGSISPGMWSNNTLEDFMSGEEIKLVRKNIPWYKRTGPGVVPLATAGAIMGSNLVDIASFIKERRGGKPIGRFKSILGGAVGGLGLPLLITALSRTGKGKNSQFERAKKLVEEAREKEKRASLGGQDLRTPFKGMQTNFPTKDSTAMSGKLLNKSKKSAEIGVKPTSGKLDPKGPSVQDLAPKLPSNKGSLPKIGAAMNIQDDPLVGYLRKNAQALEDNYENFPLKEGGDPITEEDPEPQEAESGAKGTKAYLSRLFDHKDFRAKFEDKIR